MKYCIITYGCQMNESDSEKIASILEGRGYGKVSDESKADLIVFNMCSVRQSAVDRAFAKINKYFKNKKIVVAGCILSRDKNKLRNKVAEFWQPADYFQCSPICQGENQALVPIMTGCNNFCTYCVVPYTRGREASRKADEIIKEIKSLIKREFKEILLLGQNVNSYKDGNINFPKLLKRIDDLSGNFRLSFITSHPKDMSDKLIETMARSKKLIRDIHLPVQSGDNQILKKMNRHYTVARYKNLIRKIRQKIPGIKISTDIIVGFPGESKKQFQNTVELAKSVKFDRAYVARYSPRAGTVAARLKDDVPAQEKKRRWKIFEDLINKKHVKKRI
jgi:tRNA-2-methylthio-N6-dimethylallyladenosine synthase